MGIVKADDIMTVFDIILLIYGIYTIYCGIHMKKTGRPAKWLVNEQEFGKCKDSRGFVEEMSGKTVLFGMVAIAYGISSTINRMKFSSRPMNEVLVLLFLIACVFYIISLNRAKDKYFR